MAMNPLFFCDWDFISTPVGDDVSLFQLKRCLRFDTLFHLIVTNVGLVFGLRYKHNISSLSLFVYNLNVSMFIVYKKTLLVIMIIIVFKSVHSWQRCLQ
jgi:hypothetical protein